MICICSRCGRTFYDSELGPIRALLSHWTAPRREGGHGGVPQAKERP